MRVLDEAAFISQTEQAAREGWLYQLIDPTNAAERTLSLEEQKTAGLVKNRFLAQKPSERLYLYPAAKAGHSSAPNQFAAEVSKRSPSLLNPVPFCGWLVTQQARTRVASYLGRQLAQTTPDGSPALLRFYDPRVLEHLPRLLYPWQLSMLLGPVDYWIFIDSARQVRCLEPHGDKRGLGRLKLTSEQWSGIRRIGQVNRCRELYRTLPGADGIQAAQPHVVDALIVAANNLGISQQQDIAAFVLHGLTTHAAFYRHPRMQTLFSRLGGRLSYVGLTNQLSDDEWAAISDNREDA
ncbi:DUF4123 domain-containing protein [Salinicola aestuarinus]|uniref:DUF4123 domain-containing protein n=1 Tax=Salinicola aestuarinus TaxID=1949082 RepID=UPI0013002B7F|nr:DUF4123 domain-containing protein [Salinicola aestuarinus]